MTEKHAESIDAETVYVATTCAWCGRMQRPSGEWIKVAPAIARSLREPTDIVTVSHGVCPPCAESVFGAA